jgi:hypothetical protein
MSTPQVRGYTPALYDNVEKVVTSLLGKQFKEISSIYPKLFGKMDSSKKFERIVTMAPMGDVPEKPEGNPYVFDIIQQAYTKDITPIEYGMGFEVTETAEEDDQYDELKKRTKYLMFSMKQVEDKQAAAVLNNGFTTQTTADEVALFSTAHLLKRGGTAKNAPSTDADLTITSLGQAFIDLATDTKLESGQIGAPPTEYLLVVPAQSEFIAHRIIKTTGLPGSADNDINPVKATRTITVVVNPFLTDSDSWYLIPVDKDRHGLVYLQRVGITMAPIMTEARTGNKLVKLRARKAWDSWDWRNTYACKGAA